MKKTRVRAITELNLLQAALEDVFIGSSSVGEPRSQVCLEANVQYNADSEISS